MYAILAKKVYTEGVNNNYVTDDKKYMVYHVQHVCNDLKHIVYECQKL